jgi:hypothetical protein
MKKKDQSKADDENNLRLTIYKPEDQVYQKLRLCDYLRELYDAAENENRRRTKKKKNFRRHTLKKCE